MPDPNPIDILNATLADLRSGDPDAGPADVKPGANDDRGPAAKPAGKPDATAELLALNQTPEGRAKVAAMFGIVNEEVTGPEIIDVADKSPEEKALWNEVVEAVGGQEQVPIAAQDLREALALYPEDREVIEGGGGLTPEENADATLTVISGYREALSNPAKARAILNDLWAHPHSPVMKDYIHGRDPNITQAITRLMQTAHGEKPTGRPRPKGDGEIF